jgi:hypothetical protein
MDVICDSEHAKNKKQHEKKREQCERTHPHQVAQRAFQLTYGTPAPKKRKSSTSDELRVGLLACFLQNKRKTANKT